MAAQHSDIEIAFTIMIGVVLLLLCIAGVPLNIYAIRILFKSGASKFLHKIQISMCIGNLIQIFPVYLLNAVAAFKGGWPYGTIGCMISGFWVHFTASSSVWHLVLYSVVQYISVCTRQAMQGQQIQTKIQYIILSAVWLNSFVWTVLPLVGWAHYALEGLEISCSVSWERNDRSSLSYTFTIFFIDFLMPIAALIFCYRKIFLKFKVHLSSQSEQTSNDMQQRNRIRLRMVARTGCTITFQFMFAWTPYALVALITAFRGQKVPAIAASLPSIFAKCTALLVPLIIVWKKEMYNQTTRKVSNATAGSSRLV